MSITFMVFSFETNMTSSLGKQASVIVRTYVRKGNAYSDWLECQEGGSRVAKARAERHYTLAFLALLILSPGIS